MPPAVPPLKGRTRKRQNEPGNRRIGQPYRPAPGGPGLTVHGQKAEQDAAAPPQARDSQGTRKHRVRIGGPVSTSPTSGERTVSSTVSPVSRLCRNRRSSCGNKRSVHRPPNLKNREVGVLQRRQSVWAYAGRESATARQRTPRPVLTRAVMQPLLPGGLLLPKAPHGRRELDQLFRRTGKQDPAAVDDDELAAHRLQSSMMCVDSRTSRFSAVLENRLRKWIRSSGSSPPSAHRNQERRIAEQRLRDPDALALPAGQRADFRFRFLPDSPRARPFDCGLGARSPLSAAM